MTQLEVKIIIQDHVVEDAKAACMRMQRRLDEAKANFNRAVDDLHNAKCKLQFLREEYLRHTV